MNSNIIEKNYTRKKWKFLRFFFGVFYRIGIVHWKQYNVFRWYWNRKSISFSFHLTKQDSASSGGCAFYGMIGFAFKMMKMLRNYLKIFDVVIGVVVWFLCRKFAEFLITILGCLISIWLKAPFSFLLNHHKSMENPLVCDSLAVFWLQTTNSMFRS